MRLQSSLVLIGLRSVLGLASVWSLRARGRGSPLIMANGSTGRQPMSEDVAKAIAARDVPSQPADLQRAAYAAEIENAGGELAIHQRAIAVLEEARVRAQFEKPDSPTANALAEGIRTEKQTLQERQAMVDQARAGLSSLR